MTRQAVQRAGFTDPHTGGEPTCLFIVGGLGPHGVDNPDVPWARGRLVA